jgi:hypothetical protein
MRFPYLSWHILAASWRLPALQLLTLEANETDQLLTGGKHF